MRSPATDQKEIGNDINKTKKAMRPKPKTGSPRKLEAKSDKIHKILEIGNKIIVLVRFKSRAYIKHL